MDTELLRTFLEVNRTRHFGKAAGNLFLTQSAVSARVRMLEQVVGVPLFTRARNDIRLTPAGRRLLRHAEAILTTWNRARQEIALDEEGKSPLAVCAVPDLWDLMLPAWVETLSSSLPDLVLDADAAETGTIVRRIADRSLDLGLTYEPPELSDFMVEPFANLEFVMVAGAADLSLEDAVREGYVLVNWGAWFTAAHARAFPDLPTPALRLGLGRVARDFILERGGAAYLPRTLAAADLEAGKLHLVAGAPVLERAACAVYAVNGENRQLVERATAILKTVARDSAAAGTTPGAAK